MPARCRIRRALWRDVESGGPSGASLSRGPPTRSDGDRSPAGRGDPGQPSRARPPALDRDDSCFDDAYAGAETCRSATSGQGRGGRARPTPDKDHLMRRRADSLFSRAMLIYVLVCARVLSVLVRAAMSSRCTPIVSKCRRLLCVGFGAALQNDRAPPQRNGYSPGAVAR